MPKQITRLLIAFALFVGLFLVARHFLVPASFGVYGHYRADALKENTLHDMKYVDTNLCKKCHNNIDSVKKNGVHKRINCQTCHGAGNKHIDDPKLNALVKPNGREDCGKCHTINAGHLTTTIKQVNLSKHNVKEKCVKCHNPHSPGFKASFSDAKGGGDDPGVCLTCHDNKNQEKMKGKHNSLRCQTCHGTGEEHVKAPARTNITKPSKRDFCTKCHGVNGSGMIKQIDPKDHNPDNKCIDCHKAHNPLEFKNF